MFKQSAFRTFASSTSAFASSTSAAVAPSGPTTLYAFKKQLDEYIYYNNLSSTWAPYVYRKKNGDHLTALNAVDKKNHPILPREYPGIPSKKKLTKFISLLMTPEEVSLLRGSLDELFKIRTSRDKTKKHTKYLEPSILNQYLYKCFELDYKLYSESLAWLDTIDAKDSVWSVKNTEAVALMQAMLVKNNHATNPIYNFERWSAKLQHWVNKASLEKSHSILYNAASITASIYSNALPSNAESVEALDKLTLEKVYTVKEGTEYLQYDHAFSIISALRDAATDSGDAKVQELAGRWDTFVADVSKLKGDVKSSYELFLENPVIIAPIEADAQTQEQIQNEASTVQ